MAATTSDVFPLATETAFPGADAAGGDTPVDDGANGPSSYDGAHVSTGALVAILVIVVVVAIVGSEYMRKRVVVCGMGWA
jgi:hypothetical protein